MGVTPDPSHQLTIFNFTVLLIYNSKIMQQEILISIPLNEFEKIQKEWIRQVLGENKTPTPPPDEKYLTRQETAKILQVTLPTLSDWVKRGKIKAYRINTRIRFKKSDIENALQEVVKYKREI